MLTNVRERFSVLLDKDAYNFNPIPAVATLLDPTVAAVLLTPEVFVLVAVIFTQ
jgi:hypothetical protein